MLDANMVALQKEEARIDKQEQDYEGVLAAYRDEAKGIHGALGIVIDDLKNLMNGIGHELEERGFDNGVDTIEEAIADILGEDNDFVYLYECVENML